MRKRSFLRGLQRVARFCRSAHVIGVAALVPIASMAIAAERAPPAGAYGFDWLRPKIARCQAISETIRKRVRDCEVRDGAFGLSDRVYVCRVDERSEYLFFENRAACIDNLEAMKANAP